MNSKEDQSLTQEQIEILNGKPKDDNVSSLTGEKTISIWVKLLIAILVIAIVAVAIGIVR